MPGPRCLVLGAGLGQGSGRFQAAVGVPVLADDTMMLDHEAGKPTMVVTAAGEFDTGGLDGDVAGKDGGKQFPVVHEVDGLHSGISVKG